MIASAATRWVWIPGKVAPDLGRLMRSLDQMPGVRIAVGSTARGIEGFRRSHLDAITTQRMLARLNSTQRVAGFEDVELVSLVTRDPDRADQFIKRTLGKLEAASPELRAAVLTFVNEQCNASRAAARLYTHRNTCCDGFPGRSNCYRDRRREQRARRRRAGHGSLARQPATPEARRFGACVKISLPGESA